MRALLLLLGLLSTMGAATIGDQPALPAPIAVVVAADSPLRISDAATLANIFRQKLHGDAQGHRFVPVNLPVDHPLREAFSLALFNLLPRDMDQYWNELYFQGISPPHVVSSTAAMIRFVSGTSGAIGYVLACEVTPELRVILTLPAVDTPAGGSLSCPPAGAP